MVEYKHQNCYFLCLVSHFVFDSPYFHILYRQYVQKYYCSVFQQHEQMIAFFLI